MPRPFQSRLPCRVLAAGALALAALALGGCASGDFATPTAQVPVAGVPVSRPEAPVPASSPMTGRVFSNADLRALAPGAILGEDHYAEVNSAWLARWYPIFKAKLFKLGLAHWDRRFDCNRFADFYANLAQAFFALEMFHSNTPADALALGPVWYRRDNNRGTHAIVQALTERGRVFIDPQTGEELNLSPTERRSCYVQWF